MSTTQSTSSIPLALRIIIAILLPPVAVFLQVGMSMHFWLNIGLTLCGYIPGLVHGLWVVIKK
ncbi:YqaE/Pmp3 family membrane protein [Gimesia sp.]|uniref:YqaE/Pmp3 family membrane protein n=1 Tax=Gimesia sp. TaxID=2024833 RepID=UPI003A8CCBBF